MKDAKIVLNVLSETQLNFIEEELGITKSHIADMDDMDVLAMYDRICDIEIEETCAAEGRDGDYSDRELMAEGIVTVIGNELYRPEQDEFADEAEE